MRRCFWLERDSRTLRETDASLLAVAAAVNTIILPRAFYGDVTTTTTQSTPSTTTKTTTHATVPSQSSPSAVAFANWTAACRSRARAPLDVKMRLASRPQHVSSSSVARRLLSARRPPTQTLKQLLHLRFSALRECCAHMLGSMRVQYAYANAASSCPCVYTKEQWQT